ncbi:hypothetical protein L596_005958 [Steinernema carpocapsae]|uniref:Uncharacterized protein n=1 Tax=Steinernema carpocapsae TaxID=34508 RepID=A0A4U8V1Y8_STECR|nr:hypothetical protein L596_005958 [Steinernema carpocapsae]
MAADGTQKIEGYKRALLLSKKEEDSLVNKVSNFLTCKYTFQLRDYCCCPRPVHSCGLTFHAMRKKVKKAFRSYLLSTFIENAAEKSLIGGMGCGLWHDENVEALAEQPQKQECYAKSVFRLNLWLVTSCLC